MPSINMIAPRRAEMQSLERGMHRLLLVFLVEILAALAIIGVFSAETMSTKGKISDLGVELAKLQPVVRKIEFYEKASVSLQPKLQLLNDAKDHTLKWYQMLQTLSVAMPDDTWLTRIAAAPQKDSKDSTVVLVNLNGVSANQNLVGETMLRLNSYRGFGKVDLHYTQKALVGKREAIEFEIGAGLKVSEQKKGANNQWRN